MHCRRNRLAREELDFYLRVMKTIFWSLIIPLVALNTAVPTQGATPAEIAAQQEAEDRYKRLNATVEGLQETLVAYKKQMDTLAGEIRALREENTRAAQNAINPETIKQLAEKIQEVDKKREADNKLTQDTLGKIQKGLAASLASPPRATPKTNLIAKADSPPPASSGPEKMVEYKIKKGDRLDLIVKDVRDQNVNVTKKQIMDANPNVNWNRLLEGQKIYIPLPAQPKAGK